MDKHAHLLGLPSSGSKHSTCQKLTPVYLESKLGPCILECFHKYASRCVVGPLLGECLSFVIRFMSFGLPQVLKTSECDKEMAARHSGFGQFEVPFLKSRAGLKVRWTIKYCPQPLKAAVAAHSFSLSCVKHLVNCQRVLCVMQLQMRD